MLIDFLTEIAERENWQLNWVKSDWSNLIQMGKEKRLDLLVFIAYSDERAQFFNYSKENFITGWGQVYTHDKNTFQSIIDFDNKKVAVLENGIYGISFKKHCQTFEINCQLIPVSRIDKAFDLLETKAVDGAVSDNLVGLNFLQTHEVYPTSVLFNPRQSLFAAPKGKPTDILTTIDNYLIEWRKDKKSPYYKVYNHWLNQKQDFYIPRWLITTIKIISGLLIATLLLSYFLREQVKRKTAHLKMQSQQVRQIIDLIPHFIYAADNRGEICLMNQYAANFCGINKDHYETISKIRLIKKYGVSRSLFRGDRLLLKHGSNDFKNELKILNAQGQEIYLKLTKVPFVSNTTAVPSLVAVGVDITSAKAYQKQIEHMSYHDPMTQLPNRVLLNDRIKQSLALSVRQAHSGAIILMDLDDFQTINHDHGQKAGDRLLIILANRIKSLVKIGDTVARHSGDTFVIQLNELSIKPEAAHEIAMNFAQQLQGKINEPFDYQGVKLFTTASIGVVIYPIDGKRHTKIIPRAETAMRHAKLKGKNQIVRFSKEMEAVVFQRDLIKNELKSAINNDEFELYYQPQMRIGNGYPIGFEALIRWNHKKHGMVYPDDFIPAAEKNNLIIPIGYWVIEAAFKQLKNWQDKPVAGSFIGINLSVIQIKDANLVPLVKDLIQRYQIDPSLIEFEITETVLFQGIDDSLETLNELKKLGTRLSIDDFGTGYSSLSYINRLPLDKLKIDRSFIKDVGTDKSSQTIVSTIIKMGKDLGLNILAEGVEEKAHIEFLQSIDCDYFQGYYFNKPLSNDEVIALYSKAPIQWNKEDLESKKN